MRKMSKKVFSILLAVCLLGGTSTAVMASEAPAADSLIQVGQIQPRWAYADGYDCGITDVGDNTGSYYYYLDGNSQVTKIVATPVLQKMNANGSYSNVKTLPSKTVNDTSISQGATTSITSGQTYRMFVTFKVYAGSKYETVTVYG